MAESGIETRDLRLWRPWNDAPQRIQDDLRCAGRGTCIRDNIHAVDIASAHVAAVEYLLDGRASGAINLANSWGYSVKVAVACAERATGKAIAREVSPQRPGDHAILIGCADRARSTT